MIWKWQIAGGVESRGMETVANVSPLFAFLIALLFASIAASGRFSLNATNILLFVAWAAGVFAVTRLQLADRHLKIAAECAVGILVLLISYSVIERRRKKSSDSSKR